MSSPVHSEASQGAPCYSADAEPDLEPEIEASVGAEHADAACDGRHGRARWAIRPSPGLVIHQLRRVDHLAVLTRINTITNDAYMDDPTILAWELINEPRCHSDPSGNTLQAVDSADPIADM
ncbi:hypothetical protein U9M48_030839 [Paspalum notatum var. saurae]|uniref:mannan endo-1,4-beta-mannosidase n=1 Tax=Paspalum notatum var. saurae TaxID=547442 RepID=A0AAQ3U2D3_PASNO